CAVPPRPCPPGAKVPPPAPPAAVAAAAAAVGLALAHALLELRALFGRHRRHALLHSLLALFGGHVGESAATLAAAVSALARGPAAARRRLLTTLARLSARPPPRALRIRLAPGGRRRGDWAAPGRRSPCRRGGAVPAAP